MAHIVDVWAQSHYSGGPLDIHFADDTIVTRYLWTARTNILLFSHTHSQQNRFLDVGLQYSFLVQR